MGVTGQCLPPHTRQRLTHVPVPVAFPTIEPCYACERPVGAECGSAAGVAPCRQRREAQGALPPRRPDSNTSSPIAAHGVCTECAAVCAPIPLQVETEWHADRAAWKRHQAALEKEATHMVGQIRQLKAEKQQIQVRV